MQLRDLLDVINLISRQYRPEIEGARRLELMKTAFPRPDLLAWFDSEPFHDISPEHYFTLLVFAFLWRSQPKIAYRRLVLCGGPESLAIRQAEGFRIPSTTHVWILGRDGDISTEAKKPPGHEVGVVIGTFEHANEVNALRQCLTSDFYHATRLLILSKEALTELNSHGDLQRPIGGVHSVFEGPFLHWGTTQSSAIYTTSVLAD